VKTPNTESKEFKKDCLANRETENIPKLRHILLMEGKSPNGSNRQRNGLNLGTRQSFYGALQGGKTLTSF
jgi:hypothetical protein